MTVLSFSDFINEALELGVYTHGGKISKDKHYIERVKERLSEIKILGLVDNKGNKVDIDSNVINASEKFFSKVLPFIATDLIMDEVNVKPGHLGAIRLGIPLVKYNDNKYRVVFEVPVTSNKTTKGTTFWTYTYSSVLKIVICSTSDGKSDNSKNRIIEDQARHMMLPEQEPELAKLERLNNKRLNSIDDFKDVIDFELSPAMIGNLIYDASVNPEDASTEFIRTYTKEEKSQLAFAPDSELSFEKEPVPKQMALIPGQVWWCEPKPEKSTWSGQPIISSELNRNAVTGNSIKLKLGRKWLHWLPTPLFSPIKKPGQAFMPFAKEVTKGEKVYLAKQTTTGWAIHIGVVTEISQDSRQNYPYVKTEGWDDVIYLSKEESDKIFVVDLEESRLLTFSQFIS